MIKKFKCIKCGEINEFETEKVERHVVSLTESQNDKPEDNRIAYIVECNHCKAENKIKI